MRHEKRPYKPKTDTQILGEGELRATIDNRNMDAAALRLERALTQYGRTKPNTPQRVTMRAIVDKAAENLKSFTFSHFGPPTYKGCKLEFRPATLVERAANPRAQACFMEVSCT